MAQSNAYAYARARALAIVAVHGAGLGGRGKREDARVAASMQALEAINSLGAWPAYEPPVAVARAVRRQPTRDRALNPPVEQLYGVELGALRREERAADAEEKQREFDGRVVVLLLRVVRAAGAPKTVPEQQVAALDELHRGRAAQVGKTARARLRGRHERNHLLVLCAFLRRPHLQPALHADQRVHVQLARALLVRLLGVEDTFAPAFAQRLAPV